MTLLMRLIIGLATGLLFLAIVAAVKVLCPPAYMSRSQGLQGAAFSLGTMVPFVVLPGFGPWGWSAAYVLGGLLPVLLLGLQGLALRVRSFSCAPSRFASSL